MILILLLYLFSTPAEAAELPQRVSDSAFWQMISDFSEPGGTSFGGDNFVSNETSFQAIFPALKQGTRQGSVYLGVGPEQNFSYIAALRPRIAFIVDIRRENLIEHLMYKVLFEESEDRTAFLSHLFSRARPAGIRPGLSAPALFHAYDGMAPDPKLFEEGLRTIQERLVRHGFKFSADDTAKLDYIYRAFLTQGPGINYLGRPIPPDAADFPNYEQLMSQTDGEGHDWSFLANEENFRILKDLESRNLVVPVVGDFAGPKTIRAIGQYVRAHGAAFTAIYASNVEEYLFAQQDKWKAYYANLSTFPLESHNLFIRSVSVTNAGQGMGGPGLRAVMMIEPISSLVKAFNEGRIVTYKDIVRQSQCGRPDFVQYGCHL